MPQVSVHRYGPSHAAMLWMGLAVFQSGLLAQPIEITQCGQVALSDAVLLADLVCDSGEFESVAVTAGASNIVLDLGGHIISGHPLGIGVRAMDVAGVTIRNGVIENFLSGLDLVRTDQVVVEGLTIRNLEIDDPDNFVPGLRITRSQNVMVRGSFFEFLPVAHKEAIVVASSEVTIDNIEMLGGSVGVNISSDNDLINDGSIVSVLNSRFDGVTIAGILVQNTSHSRIADNVFIHNEVGVSADAQTWGRITGLTVERNLMQYGHYGVIFMGIGESSISDNVIHNFWRGISLESNMDCLFQTGPNCFYSNGNVISDNEVLFNFLDLYHRDDAIGNTWEHNACQTRDGAEIPACIVVFLDGFEGDATRTADSS